ncbi:MAG: hypothetical protein Q9201_003762 [Fulgogasparrea decipioides]
MAYWKPGMRCLHIQNEVPFKELVFPAKFLFTCNESLEVDSLQFGSLPDIVSACTEDFRGYADLDADVIIRQFQIPNGQLMKIYEENGESIARHIWDAGIGLAAWLIGSLKRLQQPGSEQFNILELGTGCGIVGLVLGSIHSDCRALLTDLDEDALKFGRINAQRSPKALNSTRECRPLDWGEPNEFTLDRQLDFIVASDCTYNVDSIPDLVRTIADLVQQSERIRIQWLTPKVVVSTKVRHPSEAIFFELMEKTGFEQKEHASIPMDDRHRASIGQELEVVDIYVFEHRRKTIIFN